MKYKVGDKVKVIGPKKVAHGKTVPIGTISTVIYAAENDYGIDYENVPVYFPEDSLKLLSKESELLNKIIEMLPKKPKFSDPLNPGFWTDGSEILCPSEMEAEVVADFLRDVLHKLDIDERIDVHTGYYDPYEDAKSGEQDDHTGFWYIDFD